MKTHKILTLFLLLGFTAKAQVGINTTTPDTSAILHIYSNTKGVLLPIVGGNERAPWTAPNAPTADGLLVYDSLDKIYYFFNRSTRKWLALNPFQTTEHADSNGNSDDVRLAPRFQNRNVVIGGDTLPAEAKLHVHGDIRARDTVFAKHIHTTTGRIDTLKVDTITSVLHANTVHAEIITGHGTIPLGGIIMWSGTTIPDGWALCDGEVVNGFTTPDLRGRFIVGHGANGIGLPNNVWDGAYTNPGNLSERGSIRGNTGGGMRHTLTIDELPAHNHPMPHTHSADDGRFFATSSQSNVGSPNMGNSTQRVDTRSTIGQPSVPNTSNSGGGGAHENRPPYYVLAFIMRVH